LDAAEELFSERNPSDVTVREIAEKAGVTHALVHQYVGSKNQLLNAVLFRQAPNRQQILRDVPDYDEVLPLLFKDIARRRLHSRTLVRSAMDGVEYLSLAERAETGRMLIEHANKALAAGRKPSMRCHDIDPRVAGAAMAALAYGWAGTSDWLVHIFSLEDLTEDEIIEQLSQIVRCIGDSIYPE